MQVDKVILDLGGVVFETTGKNSSLIDWGIVSKLNHKYGHALNIGEDLFPVFMQDYNQLTHQNLEGHEFLKAIFDTLHFNQELINFLKARFKKLIILSDNYRENIAYIAERYHFHAWADRQFYSFDFEMTKDNPILFQKVLALSEYAAAEVIFIDDSPRKIASAEQCGIKSYLFQNNKLLFQQLKQDGYEI